MRELSEIRCTIQKTFEVLPVLTGKKLVCCLPNLLQIIVKLPSFCACMNACVLVTLNKRVVYMCMRLTSKHTMQNMCFRSQWSNGSMPDCSARGPGIESHCGQLCLSHNHCDLQPWAWAVCTFPAVPRSTQPSTLCGTVNEYQLSG